MRKFAAWMHRYVGLAAGILLFISGLTGSAVVFNDAIDHQLNPDLLRVEPQPQQASPDDMVRNALQALPDERIQFIAFPEEAGHAVEIWFRESDMRAYADPHTGEILGVRNARDSLMGFLVDLHIHLLSGETGEAIMGWAGLGGILLSVLGVWLWWPGSGRWKQAFAIKWGASPLRVWRDVHKLAGIAACGLLLMTLATGSALALYNAITEPLLIALTGEGTAKPPPQSIMREHTSASLAAMIRHTQTLLPHGRVTRVSLPSDARSAVLIRMRLDGEIHQFGRTFVWFDQYDGALLRVDNALQANLATRIQSWLYPLHTGHYGGLATRALQVAVGLALLMLVSSGVWLWFGGLRARRLARKVRR
jgi:uncharacterized iron-regulated membrane protein